MYKSQYYTCEQIDQRLLQGYLDDYNTQNNTNLTKAEFLTLLFNTVGRNNTVDNLVTQIGYYECDTAAGTAEKAITVANYSLFAGGSMKVKFVNKNTANNATLNINSQGAKALYYQGERASSTNSWDEREVVEIYYDGTSYYANNVKGGSGSGVYDISVEHPNSGPNGDGKFTLEYILNSSNVNELIPVNKRYPGMSILFVSTYDNKYVQYRLIADEWSTDTDDWAIVEEGIYVDNPEFIYVKTDADKKILYGIKADGEFFFGAGCPQQIKTLLKLMIDGVIVTKVDKEEGKSLIDAEYAVGVHYIDNPEFIEAKTDAEDKLLEGHKKDGTKVINVPVETPAATILSVNCQEFLEVKADLEGKIISYRTIDGVLHEMVGIESTSVTTDNLNLSESGMARFQQDLENAGLHIKGLPQELKFLAATMNMPMPHPTKENGKELYSELSVYNVERKACRCRFIRWNLLSPIPKNINADDYYDIGEMVGIPYSSAMENDKMVGYDISYITYLTAANNPYSMLYTENLRDNGSVYGFTYSQPARRTVAGWAGMVCNILCNYSTGMEIPYDTGMWEYLVSKGYFVKVHPQNAQGVRIGDILWESGHGRLVQNVWRDENGLVAKIEVSSGGWPGPENFYRPTEEHPDACAWFDEDLAQRNGIIYRNTLLYKNDVYEDIPFAIEPLTGESYPDDEYSYTPETPYAYNNDICTYGGDYACFREGFRIVLNYNLKEDKTWESVELYKDNTLYGTYLLSSDIGVYNRGPENFPANVAEKVPSHSFDLSFLNLTYGKYKARLINNGEYSDFTYFEIIETNVSFSVSGNKIHVDFNSLNGRPYYIRLSKSNGGPKCIYALTEEDISNDYCEFDYVDLIEKQYNNLLSDDTVLKVYFKGDYGVVTNEPIFI